MSFFNLDPVYISKLSLVISIISLTFGVIYYFLHSVSYSSEGPDEQLERFKKYANTIIIIGIICLFLNAFTHRETTSTDLNRIKVIEKKIDDINIKLDKINGIREKGN